MCILELFQKMLIFNPNAENFMTGYRIVFDCEKMVLGWESSNCYDAEKSSTLPVNPPEPSAIPPTSTVEPEATSGGGNGSPIPSPGPPSSASDFLHLCHQKATELVLTTVLLGQPCAASVLTVEHMSHSCKTRTQFILTNIIRPPSRAMSARGLHFVPYSIKALFIAANTCLLSLVISTCHFVSGWSKSSFSSTIHYFDQT
ncbi:hypothetical protein RHGRI_022603 [Rhododendron griersonianum]|uniref:Uncharacterized protein n=1 Tax=Rhododendron griersonianum TaxID=479676 RepID=A0AAV6J0F3_9ERIC|nr:hypothetical protein RHGRI_022603 [Rhododendron griersonianum]